jgi:hypothetical protein
MYKIKVFTSGTEPKQAGNELTKMCNDWIDGLDSPIEIISTHSNSNKWGWMLVVTYKV